MKGTYEVIGALHGQPKDRDVAAKVMELEDTLQKEIWDLRLGPAIWDRIKESFPEEVITDEDKVGMQLILFQKIVAKPAKEFLVFLKEVLSGSESGKRLMGLLYQMINGEINDYDYRMSMKQFDDELNNVSDGIDDDDLRDLLGGLGIDLSNN